MPWTAADIPDQHDRIAVVTGANSGIGLEAARELARAGAEVIMACRDTAKGQARRRADPRRRPEAQLEVAALDLASLDSVRAFAAGYDRGPARPADQQRRRDGAAQAPPTADGFELQFGTNHLGPLRAHRAAARQADGHARRPRGDPVEHRPQDRAHRLRRSAERALLLALAALRPVQAGQPPVRARARPAPARRRLGAAQRRRSPRLRRHQPADAGHPLAHRADRIRGAQPDLRPGRRSRRAAHALRRHCRHPRRFVRRSRRISGDARPPDSGHAHSCRP